MGLSPRVRGNLRRRLEVKGEVGSIPACTGEPILPIIETDLAGVYPRVYGGTPPKTLATTPSKGLSPRVRGNHPPQPHAYGQ